MHPLLVELLDEHGGQLPVEVYLQAALHDPQHGYYARRAAIGGSAAGGAGNTRAAGRAAGDFSTAATFHPALAWAIAAWAARHRKEVAAPGWRGRWHLIEIGAGTGQLAAEVLRSLPFLGRRELTYHIVESSPHLTAVQQQRLRGYAVRWHQEPAAALDAAGGAALIFSNELVDAFPVAVFRSDGEAWQEVFLEAQGEQLVEVPGPCREQTLARVAAASPSVWDSPWRQRPGQQVEIHLAYWQWLQTWLPAWRRGAMLTMDYGNTMERLYYRQPRGTLRSYFHQQRFEGDEVYQHFGRQDITCDVNFTDLINWGQRANLATESLTTQAEFMLAYVPRLARRAKRDARLAFLLDPDGMGSAVRVLMQRAGASAAAANV